MGDSEKREFLLAMAALAATFRQEASEAVFEGYWRGLRDLPLAAVNVAVDRAMRECKFLPTVCELRERAGVISPADRAITAWGIVRQAVDQYGCYRSVNFDDPVINATVRTLGGWKDFDDRLIADRETWTHKEFLETYGAYCRTGIAHDRGGHLIGYAEYFNPRYHNPPKLRPPTLIKTGLPPHGPGVLPAITDAREPRAIAFVEDAVDAVGQSATVCDADLPDDGRK